MSYAGKVCIRVSRGHMHGGQQGICMGVKQGICMGLTRACVAEISILTSDL